MNKTSLIVFSALAASAAAQSVNVSLSAVTPLAVSTAISGSVQSNLVPAGPMSLVGGSTATIGPIGGYGNAQILWTTNVSPVGDAITFEYVVRAQSSGPGVGQSDVSYHEVLVSFQSPTPQMVRFDAEVNNYVTSFDPAPLFEVDLGDNGLVNWSSAGIFGSAVSIMIGPQPLLMRIRAQASSTSLNSSVSSSTDLQLTVRPITGVSATRNVLGCSLGSLVATPVFGLEGIRIGDRFGNMNVLVFGWSLQPVMLPSLTSNCLLMPSADVLVLAQPWFDLTIPAAARPVSFYMQGVNPIGLETTDGYLISAQ